MMKPFLHGNTQVISAEPLHGLTPAGPWQYAFSFPISSEPFRSLARTAAGFVTTVDLETLSGRIGIGWATETGQFIEERYVEGGRRTVRLAVPPGTQADLLVIRNADCADASEFLVHAVEAIEWAAAQPLYLVRVAGRNYVSEPDPADAPVVFEDETARDINIARMAWLDASGLPLSGRRVLDVGCGPGHFARYYVQRGCTVVGVDGRAGNIAALRARLPQVEGHVGDVQRMPLGTLGQFDVVHCTGLLYHLDSPVAALRHMSDACRELLVLETMVCDSSRALMVLADESKSANQALEGIACRPSPAYVTLALNRTGFPFVYGSTAPPNHPDFRFEWRDDLSIERDGHNLRCMFVASRSRLDVEALVPLLNQ